MFGRHKRPKRKSTKYIVGVDAKCGNNYAMRPWASIGIAMRPWASFAIALVTSMAAVNWTRYRGSHVEGTRSARGVTAVLFTTRHDEMGYPRLPLLLASLCNHMKIAQELIVVTPDDEVADLIRALHTPTGWMWKRGHCSPTWPVRVVPDSYVIPTPRETLEALLPLRERPERGGRGAGYRLQMLLKLGVSSIVETPHYLTLDSDMFVTRVVSLTDLLTPEGKARVQLDLSNHRESWWTAAEAILAPDQKEGGGSSTPNVHGEHDGQYDGQHDGQPDGDHSRRQLRDCMRPAKGRLGIGVTPAVLDAAVVRALLVRLEAQWGEASVASCPYPLVSTTGTTSSSSSSNRVPAWRPIPGTECAVGDGVTAIWAGNRSASQPALRQSAQVSSRSIGRTRTQAFGACYRSWCTRRRRRRQRGSAPMLQMPPAPPPTTSIRTTRARDVRCAGRRLRCWGRRWCGDGTKC